MSTAKWLVAATAAAAAWLLTGCDSSNVSGGIGAPPPPPAGEPPQARTYDYTHKVAVSAKRRPGQYWTVAILRFGDTKEVEDVPFGADKDKPEPAGKDGQVNVNVNVGARITPGRAGQDPPQMNKRAREILKNSLVNSDAFTVVERERILEIIREINFGKTKYADPETAQAEGQLFCVRYLLEGSLGANEDVTLKDTLDAKEDYRDVTDYRPGLLENIFNPGKVDRQKRLLALQQMQRARLQQQAQQKFSVACYLSAYEVRTGAVKASVMGLGTNGLEAINDAVEELIDVLIEKDDGLRVAAVSGEKVYLDIGSKGAIKEGDRFQVVHLGQEIRNRHGEVIGHEEAEVGEIEVVKVTELMSIAKVVRQAGKMERGDLAKPAKN